MFNATPAAADRNGPETQVKNRRLYIHVGPRKTATSTIQRCLASHDNSVVYYPRTGHGRGAPGQANGHHRIVKEFFGRNHDGHALMDSLAAECDRADRNIVLSAEIIDNKDIGAFVQALLDRLHTPVDVEIVIACREHFSRAASLYNHRVRRRKSGERRLPDQFVVECAADLCYAPLVQELRPTGFAITALNYHPSSDWIERFLTHIGFGRNQMPAIESKLIASNPTMLVVSLALKAIPSEQRRMALRRAFNRTIAEGSAAPQFIFGPDAAEVAERHFAVDRQFLKEEFSIELVPPLPEQRGNGLRIGSDEFADLAAVAKDFGTDGEAVVAFASQFVR